MFNPFAEVHEPAAGYVRTTNGKDPAGFIALFAEDAVVDDAGRIIRGHEAIQTWGASDIFATNVTFDILGTNGDENNATITAKVDGTFDRTGLPDPLIMTFHIVAVDGQINRNRSPFTHEQFTAQTHCKAPAAAGAGTGGGGDDVGPPCYGRRIRR